MIEFTYAETSGLELSFKTRILYETSTTSTFAVDAMLAFILILSSVVGAQLGVLFTNKFRGEELRALLAIVVLAVAIKIGTDLLIQPADVFSISVLKDLY